MNDEDFTDQVETHEAMTDKIISTLADRILNDDDGLTLEDIDALADLLTASAFERLLLALELCPFHRIDIEICADDGRDCLELVKEMTGE